MFEKNYFADNDSISSLRTHLKRKVLRGNVS